MTEFLYQLCIAPLEALMRLLLFAAHDATGNWGLSIVLMSIGVNIVLIPVYHLAESWQEAEREMQRRMAPKLKEFKEVYKGREREMVLRGLYKIHGYSPVYALRTSAGLLIQIPFFFAAFHLLNGLPELAGQNLWFVRDLSAPDGLLPLAGHAVNVLPFVMTAINLASAAVYASRLTVRDKVQLYGLAALFLVLLYNSAAALLVYWTCNNIISCLKNVVYVRFIYSAEPKRLLVLPLPHRAADMAAGLAGAVFFAAAEALREKNDLFGVAVCLMAASLLLAACGCALRLLRLRREGGEYARALAPLFVFLIIAIAAGKMELASFKKVLTLQDSLYSKFFALSIGFLCTWLLSGRPFVRLWEAGERRAHAAFSAYGKRAADALFTAGAAVAAVLVFIYTPGLLYASDPEFFYEAPATLAAGMVLRFGIFALGALLLYKSAGDRLRPFLSAAAAWAALSMLLYRFVAAGDYGTMDGFLLDSPALLKTRWAPAVDALVQLGAGLCVVFALRKRKVKSLTVLLQGAAAALCIAAVFSLHGAPPALEAEDGAARPPEYSERLFSLSSDNKNTVVLMLDMFTGSHAEILLRENPELAEAFDGFVRYPDTLAPGSATLLSIASILGGESYTPPNINARKPDAILNEMHKGFAYLPNMLVPQGYDVGLAQVDELVPELFAASCPQADKILWVGQSLKSAYLGYWRQKNGIAPPKPEPQAPFLAAVGWFRAAPWVVRRPLYDDGSWMRSQSVLHNPSEGAIALLQSMPDFANAAPGPGVFRYVGSQVSHYPWRLDAETCMPLSSNARTRRPDGAIQEHLDAERCALKAVASWILRLKEMGVYDNTRIILVSDHDGDDSQNIRKPYNPFRTPKVPFRPDALLMVKEFAARGPIKTDPALMASSDIPALVCQGIAPCSDSERPGEDLRDPRSAEVQTGRLRTHSSGLASIRRHNTKSFAVRAFRVNGTMFDAENWRELPPTGDLPK